MLTNVRNVKKCSSVFLVWLAFLHLKKQLSSPYEAKGKCSQDTGIKELVFALSLLSWWDDFV